MRCHKKNGVKPDQPKWGPDRCTLENDKRDWVAVFCPGTGDADADEDAPFDAEAPVGNLQPVAVGPGGQIPTLPPPPPPPCDMAAWLATLDPSLGPGATTADVCRTRCGADAKDVSSMVPPFFSGAHDFYAVGGPVCIISTMVHASHIRTTPFDDCVFIACPRSNTVVTMEGDDIVYFREEVYNNRVALGPGRDRGIAHEGSTFAHYNKFKGDDGDDKLFAKGDKNWLHGANGKDKVTVVGSHNRLMGGRHRDKLSAFGDYNTLHGHTEDDSLWVPPGFTGNSLDGGPHISTDTCGDCAFSTCANCAP